MKRRETPQYEKVETSLIDQILFAGFRAWRERRRSMKKIQKRIAEREKAIINARRKTLEQDGLSGPRRRIPSLDV